MARFGEDWGGWAPYVSVGERRANALREAKKLQKKGENVEGVKAAGRSIATTFWGKGWCTSLESHGDFANRLPRGRTYVRNGSVVDLKIAKGQVNAIVAGSEVYRVAVEIKPIEQKKWQHIVTACSGQIDSLVGLLAGKLSDGVMSVITRPREGLFPVPGEFKMSCTCPDVARMCKHVAATLYGVGCRLDNAPELLFLLRGANHEELVSSASISGVLATRKPAKGRAIETADLADVFGIELDSEPVVPVKTASRKAGASKRQGGDKAGVEPGSRKKNSRASGVETGSRKKGRKASRVETVRKQRA